MGKPEYVYVASSWRNARQQEVVAALRDAEIECYDFRNPPGGTGFSWREVKPEYDGPPIGVDGIRAKGSDWEPVEEYLQMVNHPRAVEGYAADYAAMVVADTFVMVLPCGKSAHLEIGWAIGAGKRTAILLEDPVEPKLMYRGADLLATSVEEVIQWMLTIPDDPWAGARRPGDLDPARVLPDEVEYVVAGRGYGAGERKLRYIAGVSETDDLGRLLKKHSSRGTVSDVHLERATTRHERVTVEQAERERP